MEVVRRFSHVVRQGLPLRHPQEENLRAPAQAQDRLRQIELLALRSRMWCGTVSGEC